MISAYSARFASLSLLSMILPAAIGCSRDPQVSVPEAIRHSSDSEPVESYQSVDEGEDTIKAASPAPEVNPPLTANAPTTTESANEPQTDIPVPTPITEPAANTNSSPTPEPEITPPIANGVYLIQGVGSKRCLDVPDGVTTNGKQLQIWACSDTNANQMFTLEWQAEQKAYSIKASTGKQLQVSKDRIESTSPLIIGDAGNAANSLLVIEQSGNDVTFRIRIKDAQLVFDVANRQVENGQPVQVFEPLTPPEGHQQWLFLKVTK